MENVDNKELNGLVSSYGHMTACITLEGTAEFGDFDAAPRSFESPKPQEFVNNNNNNNDRNLRFPPNKPSASAHTQQQRNGNQQGRAQANAALHDMSCKDENGLEQHMRLSQDMMVSNVLGCGQSGARGMNGAPGPHASP